MKKRMLFFTFFTIMFFIMSGCISSNNNPETLKSIPINKTLSLSLMLTFNNESDIPIKYTCDGQDYSPAINITGISNDAKTLAIIVEDPDAPSGTFTHWMIWNIPIKGNNIIIPENIPKESRVEYPIKAFQGKNDFGNYGYGGPCPPKGERHKYIFKVYVLDDFIHLSSNSRKRDLLKALKGHIIQYGEVYGYYNRA